MAAYHSPAVQAAEDAAASRAHYRGDMPRNGMPTTMPAPQPPIGMRIEEILKSLAATYEVLDRLTDRIEPILMQPIHNVAQGLSDPIPRDGPQRSYVADRLDLIEHQIGMLRERLRMLADRVEF